MDHIKNLVVDEDNEGCTNKGFFLREWINLADNPLFLQISEIMLEQVTLSQLTPKEC